MFKKGLELMEELIPGYKQELCQAGALEIDQIRDIYFVRCTSSQHHYDCCRCIFCQSKHAMQYVATQWTLYGLHMVELAMRAS